MVTWSAARQVLARLVDAVDPELVARADAALATAHRTAHEAEYHLTHAVPRPATTTVHTHPASRSAPPGVRSDRSAPDPPHARRRVPSTP